MGRSTDQTEPTESPYDDSVHVEPRESPYDETRVFGVHKEAVQAKKNLKPVSTREPDPELSEEEKRCMRYKAMGMIKQGKCLPVFKPLCPTICDAAEQGHVD